MADRNITAPNNFGYDLRLGVDSISLDAKDLVVDGDPTTQTGGSGSTSQFILQRVESTSGLMNSLGVDVNVSVGSVLFGAGADARFNFAQNQQIQASSLFMTLTASVGLPDLSIDSPVLSAAAQAAAGQPDVFHDRFGDTFIKAITRGGLFVGVLRMDTSSEQDAQTIAAHLHGEYGLVASADVGTTITNTANSYNCEIYVDLFSIGGPVFTSPTDPNALTNCLNDFLTAFQTNPDGAAVISEVLLAPIQDALGPLPPNEADLEHAQQVLQDCAQQRFTIIDNLNLVNQFVQRPDRFDFPSDFQPADARNLANGLQADLDLVFACASAAMNNPLDAEEPGDYAVNVAHQHYPQGDMPPNLPTLKPSIPSPGMFKVPNIIGMTLTAADAALTQALNPAENPSTVLTDLTGPSPQPSMGWFNYLQVPLQAESIEAGFLNTPAGGGATFAAVPLAQWPIGVRVNLGPGPWPPYLFALEPLWWLSEIHDKITVLTQDPLPGSFVSSSVNEVHVTGALTEPVVSPYLGPAASQ
jgi:hypothetical protein